MLIFASTGNEIVKCEDRSLSFNLTGLSSVDFTDESSGEARGEISTEDIRSLASTGQRRGEIHSKLHSISQHIKQLIHYLTGCVETSFI